MQNKAEFFRSSKTAAICLGPSLLQTILHPIKTMCVCSFESKARGSWLHNETTGGVKDKSQEVKYERYLGHCRSGENSKWKLNKPTHSRRHSSHALIRVGRVGSTYGFCQSYIDQMFNKSHIMWPAAA